MIIKSLSRKKASFASLIAYMRRDVDRGEGVELLFHNLYAGYGTPWQAIEAEFDANADQLPERINGNAMYHEIISFSHGHGLAQEVLCDRLANIASRYVQARAPKQLAYGVAHLDTEHAHIHLLISANGAGSHRRERLSKAQFATIQKELEAHVLEKHPELGQAAIYSRSRSPERVGLTNAEQGLMNRTHEPSKKQTLSERIAYVLTQARSKIELDAGLLAEGVKLYQRGKTWGVVEVDQQVAQTLSDSKAKKIRHRLTTLGLEEKFTAAMQRYEKNVQAEPTADERLRIRQAALERTAAARDRAHEREQSSDHDPGRGQKP
jgi:hypothetical protein